MPDFSNEKQSPWNRKAKEVGSTIEFNFLTEILLKIHLFLHSFPATNVRTDFHTYPIENATVLKTKLNFRIDKNKKNQSNLWRMARMTP